MNKCFTSCQWTDQRFRLLQSSCMARPYSLQFWYRRCCPTTSEQSSGQSCRSWSIAEQRTRLWHQWHNLSPNRQTEYLTQTHVKIKKDFGVFTKRNKRYSQLYLDHHPKWRRRMKLLKTKQTRTQATQLRGVAGGEPSVPIKMIGKLMYLSTSSLSLLCNIHWMNGAIAPTRKKKVRP